MRAINRIRSRGLKLKCHQLTLMMMPTISIFILICCAIPSTNQLEKESDDPYSYPTQTQEDTNDILDVEVVPESADTTSQPLDEAEESIDDDTGIINDHNPTDSIVSGDDADVRKPNNDGIALHLENSGNETGTVTIGNANETKPLKTIASCAFPEGLLDTRQSMVLVPTDLMSTNETQDESGETEETEREINDGALTDESESQVLESEEIPQPKAPPTVKLVNVTQLIQDVLWTNNSIKSRIIPANCSIVLFYASWCPFSAKAAPHFNALPRAFPALRVAAIEATSHSSVNSYFGILSVPTILLFHNGKSIAKFNESSFTLNKIAEFIQTHTDLRSDDKMINVTSQDFAGPLSSSPKHVVDYYLILAWIFITVCFFYYITKSALWQKAADLIRTTWREAEDHVHQD